jgi:hypothetical protein
LTLTKLSSIQQQVVEEEERELVDPLSEETLKD